MPSAGKVEQVSRLKERISSSQAMLLAEYRGLSVHDATELRRSLGQDTRFSVVKNSLMKLAAGQAGVAELEHLLEGPTAVAFVAGDPVAAAKKVVEAGKRFPALALKGAFMEGRVLGADEARSLAELESREVMLSRLAGALKADLSRAAGMLQALQGRFLSVVEAYKEKVPQTQGAYEQADPQGASTASEEAESPEVQASEEGEE